ncbi:hypothetical protein NL108_011619 [Boleophthalmus pectinirostris]|nr:hypothetical protein NL108_011619 [Boleophthalmus pectinirostris]
MSAKTNDFSVESLKGQSIYKQQWDTAHSVKDKSGQQFCDSLLKGQILDMNFIHVREGSTITRRDIHATQRRGLPVVTTHTVLDNAVNTILTKCAALVSATTG